MQCNLNITELEDLLSLFKRIQKAQEVIKTGLAAHENYAATINELNSLRVEDSEYGVQLCRQGLDQIEQIRAAELALLELDKYQLELSAKYQISCHNPGIKEADQENCA